MAYKLYPHQEDALAKLTSGKILYGGVGSGKSLTSLYFYIKYFSERPLYIITTAKKRDSNDWQEDMIDLGLEGVVDSWNNIKKYLDIDNAFFIFDEQRVVGYSTWGRSFIKIAKKNKWILLSATPGDTWMDYIPVFVANGWYKHKTDFCDQHVEYDQYSSYPKIKKIHNEDKLIYKRNAILVHMPMKRQTIRHRQLIYSSFDEELYSKVMKDRWNVFEEKPIENASELLQCVRRIVATDEDRIFNAKVLIDMVKRPVVFYNYNYELEILINIAKELNREYYQWNGKHHQNIPNKDEWVYLVQYNAGSEGWNCTETNTIIFYSMNYSFRMMEQAEGRIDRLNTPYTNLEYYILSSKSKIDSDVYKTVIKKEKFNTKAWAERSGLKF